MLNIYLWLGILTFVSSLAAKRPNIVVIIADDLGWDDVSFHGSNEIPTPNIDSLAYDGIILNNYYVSPICTPTRSALMTGRHPIHTGMQHGVLVGAAPYGLPLNETLMPQYFNKLGYSSHIIGKWHLGFFKDEYTPTKRGFHSHIGYWLGAEDYFNHLAEAHYGDIGYDFHRNLSVDKEALGEYSTELFTEEAVKLIQHHNQAQPLFLYLPYQAVHSGNDYERLQAPQKYIDRFPNIKHHGRQIYAGMVSALDDGVGKVIKALKDTGMYSNSVILFSTDNGGPTHGYDGNMASNWPLRGMKNTLWEGGVRGVGFIHSPLLQQKSYVSQQMIHVCDWLPTLYRAAGGDPNTNPKMKNLDGYDLWNMLSTNGQSLRQEILHNIDPINKFAAVRVGDYKLLSGHVSERDSWYPPYNAYLHSNISNNTLYFSSEQALPQVISAQKKPVQVNCRGPRPPNAKFNCVGKQNPCLFHIPTDPCEFHNLAAEKPDIVQKLMSRLHHYIKTMVPPANKPEDPDGNPNRHNGLWVPWMNSGSES